MATSMLKRQPNDRQAQRPRRRLPWPPWRFRYRPVQAARRCGLLPRARSEERGETAAAPQGCRMLFL